MRLTDQRIRGLPFTERGQREYPDDAVRRLILRVGKRTKIFILRSGSTRKRHTIGPYDPPRFTLSMARERARDILAAERISKDETPRTTFEEALETYYRVHLSKLRKETQRVVTQTLNRRFRPTLGKKVLTNIRPTDIAPLLDTMIDTPTELHNAFVYLAMFLNWCMKRGYIESAQTARMQKPSKPPSRERVLSPDELIAVWHAADPQTDYGRIVRLAILSGQRIGQIAALRREWIKDDRIEFPADVMKGRRPHTLPLTSGMRELLPDRIGLLFPSVSGRAFSNWSTSKARLDRASGVAARQHDWRRTWATISAEEIGIDWHIIETVLHHAIGSQIARTYNRARYIEPMRHALTAFETWLTERVNHREPSQIPAHAATF
jgi:integrase